MHYACMMMMNLRENHQFIANTESERLAPPGQMYSEPIITPPTDSMYYTEPLIMST